jgi:hypothetical protein
VTIRATSEDPCLFEPWGRCLSVPRSSLTLAGGSPVWTKASHQSSTKSHRQGGNELSEAERREAAGCNVSEGC